MIVSEDIFDVIVIGGGPAGMSSALWSADLGLLAVLIEENTECGGQLLRTFNPIRNYLGLETTNGRELSDRFIGQVKSGNASIEIGNSVESVDLERMTVRSADQREFRGRSIIIATGVRRRKLGVVGEDELVGRGILGSGARDRDQVAGRHVLIVGGGDAALENADTLAEEAERVYVVHRGNVFSARASLVSPIHKRENVECLMNSEVTKIIGVEKVEAVEVRDNSTGRVVRLPVDYVLIRIGVEPNTGLFRGKIGMDRSGYIITDNICRTDVNGIYAVGDVSNRTAPTISSAVGMGATAAKAIFEQLFSAGSLREAGSLTGSE